MHLHFCIDAISLIIVVVNMWARGCSVCTTRACAFVHMLHQACVCHPLSALWQSSLASPCGESGCCHADVCDEIASRVRQQPALYWSAAILGGRIREMPKCIPRAFGTHTTSYWRRLARTTLYTHLTRTLAGNSRLPIKFSRRRKRRKLDNPAVFWAHQTSHKLHHWLHMPHTS